MATERENPIPSARTQLQPPSPQELIRRRLVFDDIFALQDKIGPIDLRVEDLLSDRDGSGDEVDD